MTNMKLHDVNLKVLQLDFYISSISSKRLPNNTYKTNDCSKTLFGVDNNYSCTNCETKFQSPIPKDKARSLVAVSSGSQPSGE
ncbi:hypothetical protein MKX01_024669, partial [Papaver californicum]